MFSRRKRQWFLEAQKAEHPIQIHDLAPTENENIVASFLREKIDNSDLNGEISPDNKTFIPNKFIEQLIVQQLRTEGRVDICHLIDKTNLPGEILERKILDNVKNIEGFFDIISRKFFTPWGSINELMHFLRNRPFIDLKYLLNKLYWSEEHLEAVLDLMAQKNQLRGYIDPFKNRLYNYSKLDFSSKMNIKKNMSYLMHFINTSFRTEHEASIEKISKLTGLSEEICVELLEKHLQRGQFLFSVNFDYLYSSLDIIEKVLKDLFVYHDIPLEFWQQRLDVDRIDLMKLLTILNNYLNGKLSKKNFKVASIIDWFENGIDVEGIASKLKLDHLELLKRILNLSKIFQLYLIAGETADPFLVKGVRNFEIFCQVDTSNYTNPQLYFECQNCKRIMCSNCRKSGSKHECPFCGNISAFIIDLPRYCSECNVTFTHSYNLLSTEECYFCKKGPLQTGWAKYNNYKLKIPTSHLNLSNFVSNLNKKEIPLKQIFSFLKIPDSEVISLLENSILNGTIKGRINIRKMALEVTLEKEKFLCTICETRQSELEYYRCISCGVTVCRDCYDEMNVVGMVLCPECGNNLILEAK
jgi:hypothetical protein